MNMGFSFGNDTNNPANEPYSHQQGIGNLPEQDAMDDIILDLDDEDLEIGKPYRPIPVGTWVRMTVIKAEYAQSKSQNNPGKWMYKITLRATEEEEKRYGGSKRQAFINAPLWSGAHYTALKFVRAMGYDPKKDLRDPATGKTRMPKPANFVGKQVLAKVNEHTDKGFETYKDFDMVGDDTISDTSAEVFSPASGFGGGTPNPGNLFS